MVLTSNQNAILFIIYNFLGLVSPKLCSMENAFLGKRISPCMRNVIVNNDNKQIVFAVGLYKHSAVHSKSQMENIVFLFSFFLSFFFLTKGDFCRVCSQFVIQCNTLWESWHQIILISKTSLVDIIFKLEKTCKLKPN